MLAIWAAIDGDHLGPGDRIPSVQELSEQLGCSPLTVREAVTQMIIDGDLVRKQGSGTFRRPVYPRTTLDARRYLESSPARQPAPTVRGLSFQDTVQDIPAPDGIAGEFGLPPGTTVVRRTTVTTRHFRRISRVVSHFRPGVFRRAAHYPEPLTFGLNALLDPPTEIREVIEDVRVPNERERDALDLTECTPMYQIRRYAYHATELVEVADILVPGDLFTVVSTVKRS